MRETAFQYIVDAGGTRTHIVLPLADYEALLARAQSASGIEISMTDRGSSARGVWIRSSMLVRAGSRLSATEQASMPVQYRKLRKKLIDDGTVHFVGKTPTFSKDYVFDNPSAAANVIAGGSKNGYEVWSNRKGQTLKASGIARNVSRSET